MSPDQAASSPADGNPTPARTPWYRNKRVITSIFSLVAAACLTLMAWRLPSDTIVTVDFTVTHSSGIHVFAAANTVVSTDEEGTARIPVTGMVTDPNITSLCLEVEDTAPDTQGTTPDASRGACTRPEVELTLVGGGFQGTYVLGKSASLLTGPRTYGIKFIASRSGSRFPVATGQVRTETSPDPDRNYPGLLIIGLGSVVTSHDLVLIIYSLWKPDSVSHSF